MVSGVRIRRAEPADAEALIDFNVAMARETENKELDYGTVSSGVRSLLARPEDGFYIVAANRDAIVGCLMVTFEWSDWRDGSFWWIQSVYVKADCRRRGVFRSLFQHLQTLAKTHPDVRGLRLYVEQENSVAQSTYRSFGMSETPYRVYEQEFRSVQ